MYVSQGLWPTTAVGSAANPSNSAIAWRLAPGAPGSLRSAQTRVSVRPETESSTRTCEYAERNPGATCTTPVWGAWDHINCVEAVEWHAGPTNQVLWALANAHVPARLYPSAWGHARMRSLCRGKFSDPKLRRLRSTIAHLFVQLLRNSWGTCTGENGVCTPAIPNASISPT